MLLKKSVNPINKIQVKRWKSEISQRSLVKNFILYNLKVKARKNLIPFGLNKISCKGSFLDTFFQKKCHNSAEIRDFGLIFLSVCNLCLVTYSSIQIVWNASFHFLTSDGTIFRKSATALKESYQGLVFRI